MFNETVLRKNIDFFISINFFLRRMVSVDEFDTTMNVSNLRLFDGLQNISYEYSPKLFFLYHKNGKFKLVNEE